MRLTEKRTLTVAHAGNQHNLIWEFTPPMRYGVAGVIMKTLASSVA